MGNLPCMGLILRFRLNPSPRRLDYADHGLPTGMDVHVLYHNPLLALPAVASERVEQHGKGARKLSSLVHMFPPHGTVKIAAVQS